MTTPRTVTPRCTHPRLPQSIINVRLDNGGSKVTPSFGTGVRSSRNGSSSIGSNSPRRSSMSSPDVQLECIRYNDISVLPDAYDGQP
ncbi:hypothetical protein Dda_4145 [Drechslerella dactyloides]|uniref:Uncharacterized protein n=1 Tax=Drechslerella dactyloides TaxID=74499 RepID=A0AAD6NKK7_DREDA|nr:hypothetical protein Dda_4145 [Drechslerella dactyloides]